MFCFSHFFNPHLISIKNIHLRPGRKKNTKIFCLKPQESSLLQSVHWNHRQMTWKDRAACHFERPCQDTILINMLCLLFCVFVYQLRGAFLAYWNLIGHLIQVLPLHLREKGRRIYSSVARRRTTHSQFLVQGNIQPYYASSLLLHLTVWI